jgi:ABC-type antimicrobial peptide transport system permease subunit
VGLAATVGEDYFSTLQLRVARGRTFTGDEARPFAPVAVISERVAHQFWGDRDPVGDTLDAVWGVGARPQPSRPAGVRIIGVVTDVVTTLDMFDAPTIYRPLHRSIVNWQLVVRTTEDSASVVAPTLAALRSIDPEQRPGVYFPRDAWRRELVGPRRLATLSSVVGATALALAIAGLVSVATFTAGQRRHEVSVRMALGARPGDVLRLLCVDGLRPVGVGMCVGIIAAVWTNRLLQGWLYGVGAYDPVAFSSAIVVQLLAATLAVTLPTGRAARTDPAQLLRSI